MQLCQSALRSVHAASITDGRLPGYAAGCHLSLQQQAGYYVCTAAVYNSSRNSLFSPAAMQQLCPGLLCCDWWSFQHLVCSTYLLRAKVVPQPFVL